jgi:16S rRNA (guanine966-N2)-methyltransferase
MRIISGSLGGRRIDAPAGVRVRPTSDRVREAIFNILGPPPPQTRVLDAFAGAGGLGLEALSRGAEHAVFIDNARASLRCLARNIDALALAGRTSVFHGDAVALVRRWQERAQEHAEPGFRWLFIDPPYQSELAAQVLAVLGRSPTAPGQPPDQAPGIATGLVAGDARIVVEHDRRNPPAKSHGSLIRIDHRRYGDTEISIYRCNLEA